MAHVIIFDEFGNEIGREPHGPNDPPEGGGGLATDDHEPTKVVLNIGKIIKLHGINTNEGKKDE